MPWGLGRAIKDVANWAWNQYRDDVGRYVNQQAEAAAACVSQGGRYNFRTGQCNQPGGATMNGNGDRARSCQELLFMGDQAGYFACLGGNGGTGGGSGLVGDPSDPIGDSFTGGGGGLPPPSYFDDPGGGGGGGGATGAIDWERFANLIRAGWSCAEALAEIGFLGTTDVQIGGGGTFGVPSYTNGQALGQVAPVRAKTVAAAPKGYRVHEVTESTAPILGMMPGQKVAVLLGSPMARALGVKRSKKPLISVGDSSAIRRAARAQNKLSRACKGAGLHVYKTPRRTGGRTTRKACGCK